MADNLRAPIAFANAGPELSRRGLADELRVSAVPVMEALQRLEHDGLVETRPRVGTRVRVPATQDILDQFTLREALEVHSARLFSGKATAEEQEDVCRMAVDLDDWMRKLNAPMIVTTGGSWFSPNIACICGSIYALRRVQAVTR